MRAVFGLVGILVTVGVIVWFLGKGGGLDHTKSVIDTGNRARDQASQFAGKDSETGEAANHSAELDGSTEGGKLVGILVTKITPNGAYQRYFGLQKDDVIVAVEAQGNRQTVKQINDEEMAKNQIFDAFRYKGTVTVVRDDKEIQLPAAGASAKSDKKPAQGQSKDETQQQIDVLQGIPGGGIR